MKSNDWLKAENGGVVLNIKVQPKSSKSEIVGILNNQLKIKIKAPPVDGLANEELIRFLSKTLRVKQNQISLLTGTTSKTKRIFVSSVDLEQVRLILAG